MANPTDHSRILVVDDAADTLELIRRNLVHHGYRVFVATGVVEAIRMKAR